MASSFVAAPLRACFVPEVGVDRASAAQADTENPKLPRWSHVVVALRHALIGLAVYVIFIYLHAPLASLVLGLCALGAATIAASVWEITSSSE